MTEPVLTVDDSVLKEHLRRLQGFATNATPAFAEIGEMMLTSVEENFAAEGRYSAPKSWRGGTIKWKDLATATVRARQKRGKGAHPILQVSGILASSIHSEPSADSVVVGTNIEYAAIHQYGGQAGRGKKVTIPPRPFLVMQDQDLSDAIDIIKTHMLKGEP
jgi:phage virion morphogenesis protein